MRLTPRLAWTDGGIVEHYEYCLTLDPSGDGASCAWTDAGANTYVDPPALERGLTYYWQVRAVNGEYVQNAGETWWSFNTLPTAPTSQNYPNLAVNEDTSLTTTLEPTNPSGGNVFFSLYDAPPAAKTFSLAANGILSFTPAANFHGTVSFQFRVTDGINPHSAPYTATITVNPVNDAPVLEAIADESVTTGKLVTFIASASDVDRDKITYTIKGTPPPGGSINPDSGVFTWIPVWKKAGGNQYSVTIVASDSNGAADEETLLITVYPERLMIPLVKR